MFENLSNEQRIALAKTKMKKVISHFVYLIAVHENNAIVVYSDKLSSQIPKSYAANAFNIFREAMHQIEIVRLCALWDKAQDGDTAKESIPTVVELISSDTIIEALAEETRQLHAKLPPNLADPPDDPDERAHIEQYIREINAKRATDLANRAKNELSTVIREARALCDSKLLESVRNLRDKQLAHLLEKSRREERGRVESAKYHDETKLLEASVPIIEKLSSWVNQTANAMGEWRDTYKGFSEALWNCCQFKIEQ